MCRAMGMGAVLLSASFSALACSEVQPGATTDMTVNLWDDTAANVVVGNWRHAGNANFLLRCGAGTVVPIHVTAAMPNLEFVRNVTVDGLSFPAFGVRGRPRTPLLVFQYTVGDGGGNTQRFPLDIRTTLRFPGDGISGATRWSFAQMAIISRGGAMESLPMNVLGRITHVSPNFPALVKTDNYSVTANVLTKTCTFSNTTVTLRDAQFGDLPSAGSDTGTRAFGVTMNCNGAFPLFLALTDANSPGNTGSRLTPTRNSTAGAVRVQLLRGGTPVVLGQRWSLSQTQNGSQTLLLAARYYRETGTFRVGVVEGQAIITATYR